MALALHLSHFMSYLISGQILIKCSVTRDAKLRVEGLLWCFRILHANLGIWNDMISEYCTRSRALCVFLTGFQLTICPTMPECHQKRWVTEYDGFPNISSFSGKLPTMSAIS